MKPHEKVFKLKNIISSQLIPIIKEDYVYMDIPYHANLGDTLIWQGTLDFLKTLPYKCLHTSWYNDERYKDVVNKHPRCLIILHGGGNFGDVWEGCHQFRKEVIANFPNHKIVIFPQTVYYRKKENLLSDAAFFADYPNATICARDEHSLKTLQEHFPNNPSLLVPDMAFYLDRHWIKPEKEGNKTLFLMRTDHELAKNEHFEVPEYAEISDWPTLCRLDGKIKYDLLRRARFGLSRIDKYCGTKIEPSFTDLFWQNILRPYNVRLVVDFLQSYSHIYTTRMHAGILGVILGKSDVNIYDNAYGKMSWFYDTWLRDVEGIQMLNTHFQE